jgi:cellulose synthase/poly-beta-1,6-N-acetylglucosamine synthase-like glycosyltransferase
LAFPWQVLRRSPLASGYIVEDMQLGIDLAIAGHPPQFCTGATVRSELPAAGPGAVSQRTRWIHGHLRTLIAQVPRLMRAALRQRRPELLGLALELSVPPLSLLALVGILILSLLLAGWLLGGAGLPAAIALVAASICVATFLLAWLRFGRKYLPLRGLLAIPVELVARVPVLFRFLVRPQTSWVRTLRHVPD